MKPLFLLVFLWFCGGFEAKTGSKNVVDQISDFKEFKKLLRTKTNVLVCFYNNYKESQGVIKIFKEVAEGVKGEGTMVLIDCSKGGEVKKMCKKLKIPSEGLSLKHYKDGEFHKNYDRKLVVNSMVNFMRDPMGDLPWDEDSSSGDVVHVDNAQNLAKFLRKEAKPVLVMFYAPWCGFCKTLKPEYAQAASELHGQAVLVAIDVNRPENSVLRTQYNISGFPTLQYFLHGQMKFQYEGDNKKTAIVAFMKNPAAPPVKIKEPEWSDVDSEVVHLTTSSFDPVIKGEASVLVMFYAPWCGHCKKMKPEYEAAAAQMKSRGVPGMLAALDATKEQTIASRFSVKGYPTIMYFSLGEKKFDVNVREAPKIVEFMRDPKEPPPPPPPEKPWAEEVSNVVHLSEDNFKGFLKKKKHVLVMFYAPWCGHCKVAKPEFTKAAAHFRDDSKVEFVAVDCTAQQALCSVFEVRGYPTIKYFSYYSKDVFNYDGGRTSEDFIAFMASPRRRSSTSSSSSDDEDAEWSTDPVITTLTDDSFKKKLKEGSSLIVMFHASWCGHCKQMKPEFYAAAKEIESQGLPNVFAMIECVKNPQAAEDYDIQGFPMVKLFQNGKFVKNYSGERTRNHLVDFAREVLIEPDKKDEL